MTDALFTDLSKTADLSDCGTYRYRLGRRWGPGSSVLWIMLNPSTADASEDDPTIRRCIGFAKRWGHGAIEVVNLYALRATDPAALRSHRDSYGPDNWSATYWQLRAPHALRLAAWGASAAGVPLAIDRHLMAITSDMGVDLHCLGTTKDGHPRHPLYVRGDTEPVLFGGAA